ALCLVSPPTVLAALVGQTAPLVGALATFGVLGLERRPRLAGALIGLAAVLKPQALLVAPAALVAAGAFEALASAAVVGVALALAATAVFGPALWGAWLAGLPAFQAEIAAVPGMMAGVIAPAGLAHELGLTGAAALGLRLALGSAALALVWIAFRHKAPPTLKAAALLVGGLLVTPYAMHYDGSLLMPVAAARATDETVGLVPLIALLAAGALTTAHLGGAALVLFALLIAFQLRRAGEAPAA